MFFIVKCFLTAAVIVVHQKTYPLSRGIRYTVPSTRFPTRKNSRIASGLWV